MEAINQVRFERFDRVLHQVRGKQQASNKRVDGLLVVVVDSRGFGGVIGVLALVAGGVWWLFCGCSPPGVLETRP